MELRDARVSLETDHHLITGTLQLPRDGFRSRVTDYLNSKADEFLPVTDAEVAPRDRPGEGRTVPFLAVAVRHVIIATDIGAAGE
jgi:hypothetical protein